MSSGIRLPYRQAMQIAERLVRELAPVVSRVEIAGSLRRRSADVGDIELVAEANLVGGLFDEVQTPDVESVLRAVQSWAAPGAVPHKKGPRAFAVPLPEGVSAEVYLVHPPAEWGSILAIRTGPAALGPFVMTKLQRRGFKHENGCVHRAETGEKAPTPTEKAFFALAGLPLLPPERRGELVGW